MYITCLLLFCNGHKDIDMILSNSFLCYTHWQSLTVWSTIPNKYANTDHFNMSFGVKETVGKIKTSFVTLMELQ